ncbi:HET-domain-containing protein [Trematosphaeria pertusa]|uniref:HET-domain-containing protein n=1 Tax=Trematosphaeria pertusa TaxID=390896 RepID=A0A6A6IVV8_9PLEO|nr:HET-domain-containing protein [Trematosphaeria pertusa]KAF2253750.1 HET-domain-containing protein [Trematosphaeria pertusa]
MPCPTCNDLHPRPPDPNTQRRSSRDDLTILTDDCFDSAETTGCETCKLLSEIVEYFDATHLPSVTVKQASHQGGVLQVWLLADLDEDDVLLDVFVPEGEESGHPRIGSAPGVRTVAPSSIEDECMEKLRRWVDECDEGHRNCDFKELTELPTRVINVGLDGDAPFLMETQGKREQYATLSYCWGKTPQLKTTRARLEEFKEALPEDLSLVAYEAIKICRDLGIAYLWIDALCIVQDDEEDWQREAAKMCEVYSSSYLTIAAAGAHDNEDGIFQDQYSGDVERLGLFLFRGHQIYVRVGPWQYHLGHPLGLNFDEQYADRLAEKSWLLRPEELPLVHRAWTVQERMLSRRVVYYTPEEMWWECDSWWYCECGTADEEKYPDDEDGSQYLRTMTAVQEANRGSFDWLRDPHRKVPMSLENAYHKWCTIVAMFSAGNLTYAKDKLPALSGLAHQFKTMLKDRFDFNDDYVAGMWRHNLERQLLWVVTDHVPRAKPLAPRPPDSAIPTWSWMSVTGNIHFISDERDMNFTPRFRIVDVSTEPMTADWAGMVKGGKLVLEGWVVHGVTHAADRHMRRASSVLMRIPNSSDVVPVQRDTADEMGPGPYICLYAAGMGSGEWSIREANNELGNVFFLLKPSEHVQGSYERVGMGLGLIPMMMKGLWDEAKMETIAIV